MQLRAPATLQSAYDASSDPEIVLSASPGSLTLRDAATPIGDVFNCETNGGVDFFNVDPDQFNFGIATNRTLEVNSDPTGRGGIRYMPDGRTVTTVPSQTYMVQWDSTIITNIPGGAPFGNDAAPAMIGAIGECRFDSPGGLFSSALLFNQATIMTANGVNVGPVYTMVNQPLLRSGTLGGSRTFSQANAVRSQLRVGPNVAGNVTLTSHEPFFATCTVDATVGTASITTINYFAAKTPTLTAGGTIGTLHVLDIENISGPTTIRGIYSLMASGQFIRHEGSAPAQFGGDLQLGAATTFDWSISRAAANRADIATGDSLRFVNGSLQFVGTAGQLSSSVDGEIRFDVTRLGFNQAPAGANWFFGLSANARTITVAGDFANCLNTTGGSHTINAALSTFTQWTVNGPAGTIGSGSVVDAANILVQTAPDVGTNRYGLLITSNPSGGTLNYAFRQSNASARARFDGRLDINRGVALGGGATATLGTIGGSGPTAAAQAQWLEIDINGTPHWIPVWT